MSSVDGNGHRSFVTTADDHSGIALTITALLMTWSVLCLLIRLYTRKVFSNSFDLDDVFCILATVRDAMLDFEHTLKSIGVRRTTSLRFVRLDILRIWQITQAAVSV